MRLFFFLALLVVVFACSGDDKNDLSQGLRGELGESCQARNDCGEDLACIGGTCLRRSVGLSPTGKDCYLAECEAAEECCEGFEPHPLCDEYRAECESDASLCWKYENGCKCRKRCEDNECISEFPKCYDDANCWGMGREMCVEGICVDCVQNEDCGEGGRCERGLCRHGYSCGNDDHCPPMHGCRDGLCVETGCTSDRECAFFHGDPRSVCEKGECVVTCSTNLECNQNAFEACEKGRCVFVGCSNDKECRSYYRWYFDFTDGDYRAVCR